MYVYVPVKTFIFLYTHAFTCSYFCLRLHVYLYSYLCFRFLAIFICIFIHLFVFAVVFVLEFLRVQIYIYIYIDMHDMHATCMSYCVALSRFFESCFGGRWCPYDIGSNFQRLTGGTLLVECLAKPTPSRAPHRRVKREE